MANRKRRSGDNEIVNKFKKINIAVEKKNVDRNKYKSLNEFDKNNMNFMMLNKQKNILNNVSKVSKKTHTLKKKCDMIESKSDKINKEIGEIKKEICEIKSGQINILSKLDTIIEYITNQSPKNDAKKSYAKEYDFYS
jgi:SMC interacting uncharacterized protein involved in chromosome segregation